MCSDWDPDPQNILESDVFHSKLLNYINAISKQDAVRHVQEERVFSGGKFTEVSVGATDHRGVSHLVTGAVFQVAMWWRAGRTDSRTDRRMDSSPRISAVFFSSYKLPKTVTVTRLLLSGPVTFSETFTQKRRRRVGAGSQHPNSSVSVGLVNVAKRSCRLLVSSASSVSLAASDRIIDSASDLGREGF